MQQARSSSQEALEQENPDGSLSLLSGFSVGVYSMWLKLDNGIATHPKVLAAGPLALAIQIRALCYASQNQTDGFIPTNAVPLLLTGLAQYDIETGSIGGTDETPIAGFGCSADELDWPSIMVNNTLWEITDGGYIIHDYLKWNISKKQSVSIIKKLSSAGKKGMKSRWKHDNHTDNQPYNKTVTPHSTSNSTSNSSLSHLILSSSESEFEQFWTHYPKKIGKKEALRAWEKAKDKPLIGAILLILVMAKASDQWTKDNGQFIPNPATWINQGRWADEPIKKPLTTMEAFLNRKDHDEPLRVR